MGIEPFLVGSALDCVLAQRLARRLCEQVQGGLRRRSRRPARARRLPVDAGRAAARRSTAPVGCSACSKTGYKGRLALHEVMAVTEDIERLTVERASAAAIGETARAAGHVDAARRRHGQGRPGVTSIEEILRVVV